MKKPDQQARRVTMVHTDTNEGIVPNALKRG